MGTKVLKPLFVFFGLGEDNIKTGKHLFCIITDQLPAFVRCL